MLDPLVSLVLVLLVRLKRPFIVVLTEGWATFPDAIAGYDYEVVLHRTISGGKY